MRGDVPRGAEHAQEASDAMISTGRHRRKKGEDGNNAGGSHLEQKFSLCTTVQNQ